MVYFFKNCTIKLVLTIAKMHKNCFVFLKSLKPSFIFGERTNGNTYFSIILRLFPNVPMAYAAQILGAFLSEFNFMHFETGTNLSNTKEIDKI